MQQLEMRKFFTFVFWGLIGLAGIPAFVIAIEFALSSFTGTGLRDLKAPQLEDVARLQVSGLAADGELLRIFSLSSGATEVQREEKERQIRGAVVEWKLPVYDVSSRADGYYVIQTSTGNGQIGTFCHVKPKDEYEKKVLVSLKPGQIITCKGVIDGVSMGNIEIDPAIILR